MPIKETETESPKAGDRILPLGSDRYFLITRVYSGKAHYLWKRGDDNPYERGIDKFVLVRNLHPGTDSLRIWSEIDKKKSTSSNVKWKAQVNWYGAVEEYETSAGTEVKATANVIQQMALKHSVSPGVIHSRIHTPGAFSIGRI